MDRVRESLFAILTPVIFGSSVLDLFAGSGSVGLEALSRGAACACFVDSNAGCCRSIRENLALLDRESDAIVVARQWSAGLAQLAGRKIVFDIIFADPPYDNERVLLQVAARVQENHLLAEDGQLILQHTVRLQIPEALPPGLMRFDTRRFGETVLTFYRKSAPGQSRREDVDAAPAASGGL